MDNIKLEKSNYGKFILKGSLAVEHYYEMNDDNSDLFDDYNKKLKEYYALSVKDENSIENMFKELKALIIKLGEENFTFYEDGDILYNYNKVKKRRWKIMSKGGNNRDWDTQAMM